MYLDYRNYCESAFNLMDYFLEPVKNIAIAHITTIYPTISPLFPTIEYGSTLSPRSTAMIMNTNSFWILFNLSNISKLTEGKSSYEHFFKEFYMFLLYRGF